MDEVDKWLRFLHANGVPIHIDPKEWKQSDFERMQDLTLLYDNATNPIPTGILKDLFKEADKES